MPMIRAVFDSLSPIDTAQSGIRTVRADRTAATSATPEPIRASTARNDQIVRNSPCVRSSASSSPAVSSSPAASATRGLGPNIFSGSGRASSTTTDPRQLMTKIQNTDCVEPVAAITPEAISGPTNQPPRKMPPRVLSARAR